jgi:PhnB protein
MDHLDQFIPHLIVSDGPGALEFYKEVFGGADGHNMMSRDGARLMHGEVVFDGHMLYVSDWFAPSDGGTLSSPEKLGGTCVRITVNVDDADSVMERAVARGSRIIMPVQDMFWGARYGKFDDPYGHQWGVNQQLKKTTAEETEANAKEFFDANKI